MSFGREMLCWSALALQNLSTRFSRVKGGTEGVGSSIEGQSLLLSEFRYRRGNEGIKRSNPRSTHEASSRGAESNWAEPTGIDPSVAPGTHPLPKRFAGRDDLLVYLERAATSSARDDPFTSALDDPLFVSLPGHPQAVSDPR